MTTIISVTVLTFMACTQYSCTSNEEIVQTQQGNVITYSASPSEWNIY